jgi:hypothetical protein
MPKKPYEKQKLGRRKFPGFDECIKMLRGEVKIPGLMVPEFDEGFGWLLANASEYIDELITEFYHEESVAIRWVLLELIGEAKSPKALAVLEETLRGNDSSLWSWAIRGLIKLDTSGARRLLWEARSLMKETEEETKEFKRVMDENQVAMC